MAIEKLNKFGESYDLLDILPKTICYLPRICWNM